MGKRIKANTTRNDLYKNTLKFLDMSEEEYSFYLFDLGTRYLKTYYPQDMDILKIRLYWKLFEDLMMLFIEYEHKGLQLKKGKESLELFENAVFKDVNSAHSIVITVKECLIALRQPTQPRTPKVKNNQLETNLNTI